MKIKLKKSKLVELSVNSKALNNKYTPMIAGGDTTIQPPLITNAQECPIRTQTCTKIGLC
ncbi:hypothetical protein SIO17_21785 [Pseudoalteromonas piscicida]|uniref:hypothetical protein n=1 Tax=Pseudoalteromonas piscicida TaxID=43662 RepID=UPI00037B36AE|nr:hypothetical protein [Pseudoalteromonas piscicida]WPU31653.1 hypothetical protein SIO17_21785 [Pseudoalteromonas piscicida]